MVGRFIHKVLFMDEMKSISPLQVLVLPIKIIYLRQFGGCMPGPQYRISKPSCFGSMFNPKKLFSNIQRSKNKYCGYPPGNYQRVLPVKNDANGRRAFPFEIFRYSNIYSRCLSLEMNIFKSAGW